MSDERLKIAVFIDFDNIEIGVKTTLTQHFDIGIVLEALKERGEIVTKVAYGDWTRAGEYGRAMSQHAIHMVQRNLTPGGDKNGADINLALDALEMAFTHSHINTFVVVGGDSDFISLVEKLKQYDRKVFVVGGRAFTSVVMQKNCTEFIAYENLISRGGGRSVARTKSTAADLSQVVPLVRRAIKLLADREVLPQLGLLKSTLLQLDSAFSEREYGASSFRDFVQKLANAGHIVLKGNDRSFHVELKEAGEREGAAGGPAEHEKSQVGRPHDGNGRGRERDDAQPRARDEGHGRHRDEGHARHRDETQAKGDDEATDRQADAGDVPSAGESLRRMQQEGYELIRAVFSRPDYHPRWPMYVRQVKQVLKISEEPFDERRFGFGGIIEAMRYCQREGLFRLERDRMGVVRVFAGDLLLKPTVTDIAPPVAGDDNEAGQMASGETSGDVTAPATATEPRLPAEAGAAGEGADPAHTAAPPSRHVEAIAEESAEAAVDDDEFDGKFVDEALGTPADADVLEGSQPIPSEQDGAAHPAESPATSSRPTRRGGRGSRGGRGRPAGRPSTTPPAPAGNAASAPVDPTSAPQKAAARKRTGAGAQPARGTSPRKTAPKPEAPAGAPPATRPRRTPRGPARKTGE